MLLNLVWLIGYVALIILIVRHWTKRSTGMFQIALVGLVLIGSVAGIILEVEEQSYGFLMMEIGKLVFSSAYLPHLVQTTPSNWLEGPVPEWIVRGMGLDKSVK